MTDLTPQTVLLDRYAQLLVEYGLNVQPGQLVSITAEVIHRDLLSRLVKAAYRRGASFVQVDLIDPYLQRVRLQETQPEFRAFTPKFLESKYAELVETGAASLRITGCEWPEYMADLDAKVINEVRQANYRAAKQFYAEGINQSRVQWSVAAAATPAWGKRLFPNLSPMDACTRLWEHLFSICRVDRENFISLWQDHNRILKARANQLTSMQIKQLHFVGPGTDLRVFLSQQAIFKGGADQSSRGIQFEPNIPTEECFSTPDCRLTSGKVSATRPFLVNGELVRDLVMNFKDGNLESFDCSAGKAAFAAYIASDDGAKRLGEVALVGTDSPIFQSGLVFEEILLDENAACHIAIGSAYRGCLRNGEELSESECDSVGCNVSSVHTDIMISSSEVDVFATTFAGETQQIIGRGRWCGAMITPS